MKALWWCLCPEVGADDRRHTDGTTMTETTYDSTNYYTDAFVDDEVETATIETSSTTQRAARKTKSSNGITPAVALKVMDRLRAIQDFDDDELKIAAELLSCDADLEAVVATSFKGAAPTTAISDIEAIRELDGDDRTDMLIATLALAEKGKRMSAAYQMACQVAGQTPVKLSSNKVAAAKTVMETVSSLSKSDMESVALITQALSS